VLLRSLGEGEGGRIRGFGIVAKRLDKFLQ